MVRFAHIADCHIGGWSEEKLKQLNLESFKLAIAISIQEKVSFILIAGDLFNTALPSIDLVKETASELKKLSNHKIHVYIIPGSHDFSPSGKTMLDVLEKAGLCINLFKIENNKLKITHDSSGIKLAGILGLIAGLDKTLYQNLDFSEIESEPGYKIFLLHTTIDEFKPKDMLSEGEPLSSLPRNFDYYAAGHVHYLFDKKINSGLLVYPGPTFPNNFKELEELKHGNFCIVDTEQGMKRIPLEIKKVDSYSINADNKSPLQVEESILHTIRDVKDKIILLRIAGTLDSGSPSDINFKKIFSHYQDAYCILKNTSKLISKEFAIQDIEESKIENIEEKILNENLGKTKVSFNEQETALLLMKLFDQEKHEAEKQADFEARIEKNAITSLNLEKIWS